MAAVAPSALVDPRAPVVRAFLETAVALSDPRGAARLRPVPPVPGISGTSRSCTRWRCSRSVHTMFGTIPDLISPYSVGNGVSERFEVWGTIVVRTVAAGFLVAAAVARPGPRRGHPERFAHPAFLATTIATAGSIVLLGLFASIGPHGLGGGRVAAVALVGAPARRCRPVLHGVRRPLEARGGPVGSVPGWIAAGCVFGGFAAISYTLLPTGNPDWLRPGDLLRAVAVATWAMGRCPRSVPTGPTSRDSARRDAWRAVALDLHDGLAQELALLTTYRYGPGRMPGAQPQWHEQLQMTAERALAEARRAIAALAAEEVVPFETDLEQTAESISGTGVAPCSGRRR